MRARWVAATLLPMVMATGCGESAGSSAGGVPSSTTPSPTTSSTSTHPSSTAEGERCPYLTTEQVAAALGAPVVQTAGSLHACFFDPVGGDDAEGASVMLSRVDVQIDPADYAAQTRTLCHGEVADVDAGDDAFACVTGLGPQGQLYAGRVLITVTVNDAGDDATGLDVASALMREVTIPPPS